MLRHQHTSTLFPYTTLFRSRVKRDFCQVAQQKRLAQPEQSTVAKVHFPRNQLHSTLDVRCIPSILDPIHRTNGDRKSTRLNSSHTVISYAVFCLKKKSKIQT